MINLRELEEQSRRAVLEICEVSGIKEGQIFVVGCSSSEVIGSRIGTATNMDAAEAIYNGIAPVLQERGIFLAGQCCEHLNRALVIEEEVLEKYRFEQVNAIPQPNHAGGAFATVCYRRMKNPVLTAIRISLRQIGEAAIICARTRPRYIGGPRALYDERLM